MRKDSFSSTVAGNLRGEGCMDLRRNPISGISSQRRSVISGGPCARQRGLCGVTVAQSGPYVSPLGMLVKRGGSFRVGMMPYFLFKGLEVNSGTCGCGAEVSTIFEMDVEMFEIVLCGEFYGAGGR